MRFKKGVAILSLFVILMLSFGSIVQAAPRLQTGDDTTVEDDQEQGDSQEQQGTVLGDRINLGKIMSGKNGTGDTDGTTDDDGDDDTDDDGDDDGDDDDDDDDDGSDDGDDTDDIDDGSEDGDDTDDDGDDDGSDDGDDDTGDVTKQHPVAAAIADFFGVDYEEVFDLHLSGNGFGNIAKAFFVSTIISTEDAPVTPGDLLDEAHGTGWGNVMKNHGLHPGVGKSKKTDSGDQPEDELSAQSSTSTPELAGSGSNGQGNSNNANGSDNGNGKGKDKDKGKDKENNGKAKGHDKKD